MDLVWLAIERMRHSHRAFPHIPLGVPSSWRFKCMRRHDTHGAMLNTRFRSPGGKAHGAPFAVKSASWKWVLPNAEKVGIGGTQVAVH